MTGKAKRGWSVERILTHVGNHLRTQLEKAALKEDIRNDKDVLVGIEGSCMYRMTSEDGKVLKCAVGCLIPSRAYTSNMEHNSLTTYEVAQALVDAGVYDGEGFPVHDSDLSKGDSERHDVLHMLQKFHDDAPRGKWTEADVDKAMTSICQEIDPELEWRWA